jgi:dUTPase
MRCATDTFIASKHSIDTGAGVIDADYRGPVMVLLFNYSDVDFTGKLTSSVDLMCVLISVQSTRGIGWLSSSWSGSLWRHCSKLM